jgi:hypothetical protein
MHLPCIGLPGEVPAPIGDRVRHCLFIHGDVLLTRMIAGRAYQETTAPDHRQGSVIRSHRDQVIMIW